MSDEQMFEVPGSRLEELRNDIQRLTEENAQLRREAVGLLAGIAGWQEIVSSSVLREWVMKLSKRHQGVLISAVRSCDMSPKLHGDITVDRALIAYLRYLIMNPADEREVGILGAFMRPDPPNHDWQQSQLGHLPLHYVAHLMHAYEVVGYKHPHKQTRGMCLGIYSRLVGGLHLREESEADMDRRLTEDRISSGKVVS